MSVHLDTNAVVAILKGTPSSVRRRFRDVRAAQNSISISAIVLFELWFGAAKSERWQENANRIRDLLEAVTVAAFDEDVARVAGELRATLNAAGTPIGAYDLLIAAQALREGTTLVTANTREFGLVPGLAIEDWTI